MARKCIPNDARDKLRQCFHARRLSPLVTIDLADAIATSILYRLLDLPKLDEWNVSGHPLRAYLDRLKERPGFRVVFEDDPNLG